MRGRRDAGGRERREDRGDDRERIASRCRSSWRGVYCERDCELTKTSRLLDRHFLAFFSFFTKFH
jgi:hypothetical protein